MKNFAYTNGIINFEKMFIVRIRRSAPAGIMVPINGIPSFIPLK